MIDYDDLIGIPFINGGRDRNKGFDCYGLVMEVYRRCGIALPEYTADWDDEEKINSIVQREAGTTAWHRVKAPLPVPCLVALRMGTPPGIVNPGQKSVCVSAESIPRPGEASLMDFMSM